jgi:hypothetical protein
MPDVWMDVWNKINNILIDEVLESCENCYILAKNKSKQIGYIINHY